MTQSAAGTSTMNSPTEILQLPLLCALGSLLTFSALAHKPEGQNANCCRAFLRVVWKPRNFGDFEASYQDLTLCYKTQPATLFTHKKKGKVCVNPEQKWVKQLKNRIDEAGRIQARPPEPPAAEKQFASGHSTLATEENLRSTDPSSTLAATEEPDTTLPVKRTQGSRQSLAHTPTDDRPVTVTSGQTTGANLSTPAAVPTAFPGFTRTPRMAGEWGTTGRRSGSTVLQGLGSSKRMSSEGGTSLTVSSWQESCQSWIGLPNGKAAVLTLIPISLLLLLSTITYKWCKKPGKAGCPRLCRLRVCKDGLEKDGRGLVQVHPEQLRDGGLSDLWAVPRDPHRDRHQVLLEDHQLGERRTLVFPMLVGLPAQRDVCEGLLPAGTFQAAGVRPEGRTEDRGSQRKGSVAEDNSLGSFC